MMSPNETTKVYEALNWASSFLEANQYERQIGDRLLQHHTGWTRTQLLTELQTELTSTVHSQFVRDVELAATGIPVQHITGNETFYGREYAVNQHVLIPRPETEELIEAVLAAIDDLFADLAGKNQAEPLQIIDVGTGSGIIAITLALELAHSRVLASDISTEALAVAKRNATNLAVNITFCEGDLLTPFLESNEKASIIVSNPPYIPEGDRKEMKSNVTDHEPENALFAGGDGLDIYRRLVKQIPNILLTPGIVAFEIGHDQGESVRQLLATELPTNADIQIINDINNNQRIVLAKVK
ncbi:peptide chain release factor N(5)-glutamine methyltransferase [Salipaludibacillus sp. HK11]|uniref:peptide chain release factor N(5)-glutamine methyltransferase n=1 Tax=Salipaludibacillus sp. HK11 TaxID=3394320 RepID=UPI0039FCC2BD